MQVSSHNLTLSVPTVGHCWCMQFSSHNSHEKRLRWANTQLLMTFAREIWKSALSVRYILLLLGQPHETVLPTSATNSQIRKVANYFIRGCCFGACRLISAQSKVKITVPCQRWDNFLLAYLCVLTLLLVLTHYTTRHTRATASRHISNTTTNVVYFCNLFSSLASETGLLLNT